MSIPFENDFEALVTEVLADPVARAAHDRNRAEREGCQCEDKPIQCRCGELRQAHAKGWRFGTCEDGEPHWQCPECVKQGTEPQPT
mgnify:FL=1